MILNSNIQLIHSFILLMMLLRLSSMKSAAYPDLASVLLPMLLLLSQFLSMLHPFILAESTTKIKIDEKIVYSRPNILLVIGDDMNAQFGPYASPKNPLRAGNHTPSFDRLAKQSVVYLNAYSQYAVCGPSRESFLTGRSPDTLKIYNFERWFPQVSPLMTTLPKYLIDTFGYYALSFGKVFHENGETAIPNVWFDQGHWSAPAMFDSELGNTECTGNRWYCALPITFPFGDDNSTNGAIMFMNDAVKYPTMYQPFFLVVGYRRPHMMNSLPEGLMDTIPLENVTYPELYEPFIDGIISNGGFRKSLPYFICKGSTSMKNIEIDVNRWSGAVNPIEKRNVLTDLTDNKSLYYNAVLRLRRSYFAAMKSVDIQLGKLLDVLERTGLNNSTIVIFISDHGFSMGEKGMWCKNSLTERVTKVPIMMSLPKGYVIGKGVPTQDCNSNCSITTTKPIGYNKTPVQLLDLFPTIIDLLGGSKEVDESNIPLDGISFIDTLKDPSLVNRAAAYSQYGRCQPRGSTQSNPCTSSAATPCSLAPIIYMGYSIRTSNYRYVEWRPFKETTTNCSFPSWDGLPGNLNLSEPVRILNVQETGTLWDEEPIERELYANYSNSGELGETLWEMANLAYSPSEENKLLIDALSLMIRYQHDPKSKRTVCSNKGLLKLNKNASGKLIETCECIPGWIGIECNQSNFTDANESSSNSPTLVPTSAPVLMLTKLPTANPTRKPETSSPTISALSTPSPSTSPYRLSFTQSPSSASPKPLLLTTLGTSFGSSALETNISIGFYLFQYIAIMFMITFATF